MSPFGYGHDPNGVAAPANPEETGAGPPLLHAATSRATEANAATWTNKNLIRIWLTAFKN